MNNFPKTLFLLLCSGLFLYGCGQDAGNAASGRPAPPPLSVQVHTVEIGPVANMIRLSGRAKAYREAEIRPEVSGLIVDRLFEEGQEVSKGTALYKIDSARYLAEVESAKAGLARAEAASKLADETLARFKRLADIRAVSQQEYQQALASSNQAKADINIQRAAVDRTNIDYQKTTLRAPIDGQIGRSSVTTGALVTANQATSLARILLLDPIYIDLAVASSRVVEFNRQVRSGEIQVDDFNTANVDVILENGQVYEHRGKIAFREVSVDETTGTVILRATVPNPDGTLLPGMYLQTNLTGSRYEAATTVPQEAVIRTARGDTAIYLVNAENTVERRFIKTDGNLGTHWIVTTGLNSGDKIITSNLQKVREGIPVTPVINSGVE